MKYLIAFLILSGLNLAPEVAKAQYAFLTKAPAVDRLKVLWRHCSYELLSDKDSASTCQFLEGVTRIADSLHDNQLAKYSVYFRKCFRVLFSSNYQQYFADRDYESPAAIFKSGQVWAQQNGYTDIAAACEHNIGEVYFYAGRYGLAFEHLLKADKVFRQIGYENVPAISIYLYNLGLNYYRFEEFDKSLDYFLAASRYPFYLSWAELSTLNSIGLIYARNKNWDKAASYYLNTIERARYHKDVTWVGIASGSLGNVFLNKGENDSALFYHRKNYFINISARAPEDAAKSALAIATALIRQRKPDSVLHYVSLGRQLAHKYIRDSAQHLEYQRRLLATLIEFNKAKGDYKTTLLFSDSLTQVKESLQQMLDAKILNRAVEKSEAERYISELKLLDSQKTLSQLRAYLLIAVLFAIIIIGGLLINRYRLQKFRQAQLAEKEKQLLMVEKLRAEEKLTHAEELLTAYLATIKEKTELIENLDAELQKKETSNTDVSTIAANMEKLVSGTILTEDEWRDFRVLFEQVHPGFLYRLKEKYSVLSPAEMRLLILTKLNLSTREMAHMLGVSIEAIRKSRYRVRKKLNLEEETNLDALIQEV